MFYLALLGFVSLGFTWLHLVSTGFLLGYYMVSTGFSFSTMVFYYWFLMVGYFYYGTP